VFGDEPTHEQYVRSGMSHSETADDVEAATAAFEADHDGSWSANLEEERHAESRERVIDEALQAVAATRRGTHVNLVTHGAHGDPRDYLWDALESVDRDLRVAFVDRCGCGGYVTRVHVE
jgi:putative CGCGG family rSAM target protein